MAKEVSSKLKSIMEERGLSIRQLADMSGLKFETVRKLRNDETVQYHRKSVGAICEALDIDVADILELKNVKT
jgi:putative transcriptional regulator